MIQYGAGNRMADGKKEQGKTSPMMAIVAVLLLTLIGAGAGFAVGSMLGAQPAAEFKDIALAEAPAQAEHGEHLPDASTEGDVTPPIVEEQVAMAVVPFPPILTNLAEPKGVWVRLEGSLLIKKESDEPHELLAEKADENLVTFLRTVKLKDIEGPSGFLNFRADLNDLVSLLSDGQVKEVIIHSVVLE
jgi:flagellar protein FliL